VWLLQENEVVGFRTDGMRTSIGRPWNLVEEWVGEPDTAEGLCLRAAGADGSVWVSPYMTDEYCRVGQLAYWDGQGWVPSGPTGEGFGGDVEGGDFELIGLVVTDDGAAWADYVDWRHRDASILARHADGRWETTTVARFLPSQDKLDDSIAAAPGGRVCDLNWPRDYDFDSADVPVAEELTCYDATGEVARFDVSGMGAQEFSVAPDGGVWVWGSEVIRLGVLPTD
jgi:hypothetical protein